MFKRVEENMILMSRETENTFQKNLNGTFRVEKNI